MDELNGVGELSVAVEDSIAAIDGFGGRRLSELDSAAVAGLLERYGALLLRNFEADVDVCRDFTSRLGTIVGTSDVSSIEHAPLHGELTYTPFPPDLVSFYCVNPAASGGETTLCDGVRVVQDMPAPLREFFARTKLRIHSRWDPAFLMRRFGAPDLDALAGVLARRPEVAFEIGGDGLWDLWLTAGAIRRTRARRAEAFVNSLIIGLDRSRPMRPKRNYTVTLEDGGAFPESVLAELIALTERHTYCIRWRRHDFAIVDNSRMLHGRRPTGDPSRRLYVMHAVVDA